MISATIGIVSHGQSLVRDPRTSVHIDPDCIAFLQSDTSLRHIHTASTNHHSVGCGRVIVVGEEIPLTTAAGDNRRIIGLEKPSVFKIKPQLVFDLSLFDFFK